jgi:hypothetical protein
MQTISSKIESLKPLFLSEVSKACTKISNSLNRKASKHYEYLCSKVIIDIITQKLPEVEIIPTSERVYPEILFTHEGKNYAIDIKTANGAKNPAFDLCYLATYKQESEIYEQEWILSVEYDANKDVHKSFIDCHFNRLYELVSVTKAGILSCGGHKVKIRPISWKCIRSGQFTVTSKSQLISLIDKTVPVKYSIGKYKKEMDFQTNNLQYRLNGIHKSHKRKLNIDNPLVIDLETGLTFNVVSLNLETKMAVIKSDTHGHCEQNFDNLKFIS